MISFCSKSTKGSLTFLLGKRPGVLDLSELATEVYVYLTISASVLMISYH